MSYGDPIDGVHNVHMNQGNEHKFAKKMEHDKTEHLPYTILKQKLLKILSLLCSNHNVQQQMMLEIV